MKTATHGGPNDAIHTQALGSVRVSLMRLQKHDNLV